MVTSHGVKMVWPGSLNGCLMALGEFPVVSRSSHCQVVKLLCVWTVKIIKKSAEKAALEMYIVLLKMSFNQQFIKRIKAGYGAVPDPQAGQHWEASCCY